MVQYPVRAGRREWIGLAVLALPTLLVTMDLSVLFVAVPKLTGGGDNHCRIEALFSMRSCIHAKAAMYCDE